jgi:hypothetical protein
LRGARVRGFAVRFARQTRVAQTIHAMHKSWRFAIFAHQRRVRAARDRNLIAPCQFEQTQRVARGDFDIMISKYGGQREDIQFRRLEREQDRHEIVNAGIGVNNYRFGHKKSLELARA